MLNIDDRLIKEVSPKIGANALAVLLAIAIHLNQKTNRAFPSHRRLMELTGLGRDAVYGALSKLQDAGLLKSNQSIDSKRKTFGRREFKVSTRFIKIFVDAEDIAPLPEIPYTAEPYTAEPYTAEPYTENPETYQINNGEQINNREQINNVCVDPPTPARETPSLEAGIHRVENEGSAAPPPAAPKPPAVERWLSELTTDYRILDGFRIGQKVPERLFPSYVEQFTALARTHPEKYGRRLDLVGHFLNWSRMRYNDEKPATANGAPANTYSNLKRWGAEPK